MSEIMIETILQERERLDEIGFGGLRLIQKPEEFCYGVDAVILADFASKYSANHSAPQWIWEPARGLSL